MFLNQIPELKRQEIPNIFWKVLSKNGHSAQCGVVGIGATSGHQLQQTPSFFFSLSLSIGKVIHPKYYKKIKENFSAQPFVQIRNGLFSGR